MSWVERVKQNIEITTGDGQTYTPLYMIGRKSFGFNVSEFEFINVPGTLVNRRQHKGTRFNLTLIFQGEDHLDVADRFEISAKNRKAWEIFHPMYGEFTAQPISMEFDSSKYNTTTVTAEVVETITEDFPKSPEDSQTTAQDFSADFSDDSDSTFEGVQVDVAGQNTAKENAEQSFDDASSQVESTDDYNDYFNTYNDALNAISNIQSDAITAVAKARELIFFPATLSQSVQSRINILQNQFDYLIGQVDEITDYIQKLLFENNAGNTISAMITAAVTPQEDDYQNADQVLAISDTIINAYDQYLAALDTLQTDTNDGLNSYAANFQSVQTLSNGVYYVSSELLEIALGAQQQRTVILPEDNDIINLTHRYYGLDENDNNIKRFKNTNNIGINELLVLKKGRKIIYYV